MFHMFSKAIAQCPNLFNSMGYQQIQKLWNPRTTKKNLKSDTLHNPILLIRI